MSKGTKEHAFSIELNLRAHVKHVAVPNIAEDRVLIEGFLGELKELSFIEVVMLESEGTNGIQEWT